MEQKDQQKPDKLNWKRVLFSIIYLLLALLFLLLIFLKFRERVFYFAVEEKTWNGYRFLWCLSAVLLGFFTAAVAQWHNAKSPLPLYITHYPLQLIAMATLVFGALHVFEATSGYLFYYLSFGLCFTLGNLVDSYWSFIKAIIVRSNK
jgi:hypothetical protein